MCGGRNVLYEKVSADTIHSTVLIDANSVVIEDWKNSSLRSCEHFQSGLAVFHAEEAR